VVIILGMKAKERQILNQVSNHFDIDLKEVNYEYSRFDAYGDAFIVEIKDRGTFYKKVLIEFDKYTFNKEYAKLRNKHFLYVVGFSDDVYLFNVSDLDSSGYNYRWHWRMMPKQTEFSQSQTIYKFVGYIDVEYNVGII